MAIETVDDTDQVVGPTDLVAEARAVLGAAAPGPWFWRQDYEMPSGRKHWALTNAEEGKRGKVIDASLILQLCRPTWFDRDCPTMPNWQLIARAPELISFLCDEVERLRKENELLRWDKHAGQDLINAAKAGRELIIENEALRQKSNAAIALREAASVALGIIEDGDPRDAVIFLQQAIALADGTKQGPGSREEKRDG